MFSLKNTKIGKKVAIGFAVVLLLLTGISGFGIYGLSKASEEFSSYRASARSTAEIGRVQANLLLTRLYAKDFILRGTDESIANVRERAQATLNVAERAKELAVRPEEVEILETVANKMVAYNARFDEIVAKQATRNTLVLEKLNTLGPEMRKNLQAIMDSAFEDGDAEAAYYAGNAMTHLMLARLYVQRYLITNTEDDFARVNAELASFRKAEKELVQRLENPTRRSLAEKISAQDSAYAATFAQVYSTISDRNTIIRGELDKTGPEVAAAVENLKLQNKEIQDTLGPKLSSGFGFLVMAVAVAAVIGISIGIFAAWAIGRAISRPVGTMTDAMRKLAEGDTAADIPAQDHGDELGSMAQAVQVFKENMVKAKDLADAQFAEQEAREKRTYRREELTNDFDAEVGTILSNVTSASKTMQETSNNLSQTAKKTSEQASVVASASNQASENVQTVAAASEELASSINEIGRQVAKSTQIANSAVTEAVSAQEQVTGLVSTANNISDVIDLINDIAEQTNLLALNATIEAARAGEAGKGFAVVASEVKNLASQTARATQEITSQISEVQTASTGAANAIKGISEVIAEMNDIATSIASAVEEQTAATQEIARNVEEAASGTDMVNSNITSVNTAANDTGAAASQVLSASTELMEQSEMLNQLVEKFLSGVKAA